MADISLKDLASTLGTNTGDFLRDAGNAIANSVCSVYKNYPGYVVGNPLSVTGVEKNFGTGLMNSLCNGRPPGLPSPPSQPFSGGQCNTNYNVFGTYVETIDGSPPTNITHNISDTLSGPIYGITIQASTSSGGTKTYSVYIQHSDGSGNVVNTIEASSSNLLSAATITSVSRTDGQPDNCGDPPPSFPTVYPPANVVNVSVPVPQPGGFPNINVPIIVPQINGSLTVPVTLNGTFNFNFDLGGLTINLPGKGGGQSDPTTVQNVKDILNQTNNINNNVNNLVSTTNNVSSTVNNTNNTVNTVSKKVDPPRNVSDITNYNTYTTNNVTNNKRTGIDKLFTVRVTITSHPINIYGRDAGQFGLKTFGGFFFFTYGGVPGVPTQINLFDNEYAAPPQADGYGISLEPGWTATTVEYTQKY